MKHVAPSLLWFAALWWLWMLLVGEWNEQQLVAASGAAAVATGLCEVARARARAQSGRGLRVVAEAYAVLPMVVVDFGLIVWALLRRRQGTFVEVDTTNAWAVLLASYSPNAYVAADDRLHRLVPFERSEAPLR